MRDFERVAEIEKGTPQYAALKAAHGVEKAPTADGKRDKPRNGVFNLDNKTTSGNNQNNGKGVNDGKVDLKANTTNLKRSGRNC